MALLPRHRSGAGSCSLGAFSWGVLDRLLDAPELEIAAASGTSVSYKLRTFAVGNTAAGNLTVSPSTLTGAVAARVPLTLKWTGLDATKPYLGWVGYGSSPVKTIVSVN